MCLTRPIPTQPGEDTSIESIGYASTRISNKWRVNPLESTQAEGSVIILAADRKYLPHAKSAMVGCRLQGQWQGDFALIVPKGQGPISADFSARGIHIVEAESSDGFYQKFNIFDSYFRRWKKAFYMDCDVLVQGTLAPLLDDLDSHPLIADIEPFSLFHTFTYWSTAETYDNAPKGLYDWLWTNYNPNYLGFNTALILFRPDCIPIDAVVRLQAMQEKIRLINTHVIRGTDQSVINLTFYRQFTQIRDKMLSYWQHEGPESRVLHYCSGYAPWIDKLPGMDAYGNAKLKLPCHDIYTENLARWAEVFPIC